MSSSRFLKVREIFLIVKVRIRKDSSNDSLNIFLIVIILKNVMKRNEIYVFVWSLLQFCPSKPFKSHRSANTAPGTAKMKHERHANRVESNKFTSMANDRKMLLLFTLMSSFQALVVTASEIPSSRNETLIGSAKKVAVRIVGGEITNIRNYPFLVGEMRPWSFLNIKSNSNNKKKKKEKLTTDPREPRSDRLWETWQKV